jgi:hypothetical protein
VTGGEFVIEHYGNGSRGRDRALECTDEYTHFLVSSSTQATLKLIDIRSGACVFLVSLFFHRLRFLLTCR